MEELGALGRGEHMEIGTYVEKALRSELSANIIDLCPVGALTSKPYAFIARPWELAKTESVDVHGRRRHAISASIRAAARCLRVLPRLNEAVNEEWISDKTRFACDGLIRQRLDRPYVRRDGKLKPASWQRSLRRHRRAPEGRGRQPDRRIGRRSRCDGESMFALKELMASLGSPNLDCRQDGAALDPGCPAGYLFNTTIAGIEQSDACLIVGSNPRWEAPIINARILKRYNHGPLQGRGDRPEGRSHLQIRLSRRRAGRAEGARGRTAIPSPRC